MFNCVCDCNLGFWESFHKTGIGIVAWSLFSKRLSSVLHECFQKAVLGFRLKLVSDSPPVFEESIGFGIQVVNSDLSEQIIQHHHDRNSQSPGASRRFTLQSAGPSTNELSSSDLNDPAQSSDIVAVEHQTTEGLDHQNTVRSRKPRSQEKPQNPEKVSNKYKPLASSTSEWIKGLRR